MAAKNLYKLLGVEADATPDEIRRAYHKAAKKLHPDVNQGSSVSEAEDFNLIKEAYEILTDPKTRAEHDRELGIRAQFGNVSSSMSELAGSLGAGGRSVQQAGRASNRLTLSSILSFFANWPILLFSKRKTRNIETYVEPVTEQPILSDKRLFIYSEDTLPVDCGEKIHLRNPELAIVSSGIVKALSMFISNNKLREHVLLTQLVYIDRNKSELLVVLPTNQNESFEAVDVLLPEALKDCLFLEAKLGDFCDEVLKRGLKVIAKNQLAEAPADILNDSNRLAA